ncbi:hypothetical protein [Ralstonia solanacearum]|uniref:hypothetical protein n=1 Tax=Ralstonia solanacearum TaxID=305 RepID=UPI000BE786BA|nr:hypothetical protein [Ralstonia solanacearum]ATJ87557.1 hypothetical protein CDC59_15530 [Ralstonia solanacearum]
MELRILLLGKSKTPASQTRHAGIPDARKKGLDRQHSQPDTSPLSESAASGDRADADGAGRSLTARMHCRMADLSC